MTWKNIKLKDCSQIVSGSTPSRNVDEYWGGDIWWTTPKDFSKLEGKYISFTPNTITKEGYKSCSTNLLPPYSVILSSRAPIGLVAINTVPMATNQGFKSFVPDPKKLDSSYLYYWLKANTEFLQSLGRGATFKEISKKIVEDIEIPLPPLGEQQRITAVLDKADELRAKRRTAVAKLDTLLQSTFLHLFGDPVTNPMGWESHHLSRFFSQEKEGTKCGPFGSALKREEYVDHGIPVWIMDNIRNMEFKPEGSLFITPQKYKQLVSYSALRGDIIISRAGTVGKMCVVETDEPASIISTNLIRLSLNSEYLDPYFFVSLMTFFKGHVGRLKTGEDGAYSFMNTGILKKLKIPVPSIKLQRDYRDALYKIRSEKQRQELFLGVSDNLFHALQQRAFNGQL